MGKRNARAGLFNGHWLSPDLKRKSRRITRGELGECYRLWYKHADIRTGHAIQLSRREAAVRLGIHTVGEPAPWTAHKQQAARP